MDRFAHPDGKARFHAVVPRALPEETDSTYPLVLTTGRILAQFLSGNQTSRIERQNKIAPHAYVEIHPETAAAYELHRNGLVELSTRQGTVSVPWRSNRGLRHDTLFMPYHWPECNTLVAADLDPLSKIPGFKYTPVMISTSAPIDLTAETTSSNVSENQR